ncbi:MAG: ribose-phosphate diphosphokinase [Alkalispirochaetaceae bacterium]
MQVNETSAFIYPEQFLEEQAARMESNQGRLMVASCTNGEYMADQVVDCYRGLLGEQGSAEQLIYLKGIDRQFSDTETMVRLEHHVGGADVFLFQSLLAPAKGYAVNDNYLSLLIAARGFREHGANRVTAVLPYLTYSRQDKPTKFKREPTTAKLMADLARSAGIDRVVAWNPHSTQIHGFYADMPVNMLDPLTMFNREFEPFRGRKDVIAVAPDAGATKLIMHFSRELEIDSAIASKHRPRQEEAVITDIIGDFRGKRTAIVLDDMIASAKTVVELVEGLVQRKGIEEVLMAASHNLCLPGTRERLERLHNELNLKKVVVTNSIPQTEEFLSLPFLEVRSLAEIFCYTINRVHYDRSVSEIFRSR